MKRTGFRLPQGRRCAPFLTLVRGCLVAWAAVLANLPANAADGSSEAPDSESSEERSVVYSLKDYERLTKSSEERASDYVDGIQRSLEGPDVVITAGTDRTVYEYRQNGQLRLVKIIPRIGRPYYLVPADQTRGFGNLSQADMLLPQWTIIEF